VSRGIAGFSEEEIQVALERNLWELWSHFGRAPDCALYENDHAIHFDTPIPILPYNAVLRFSTETDVDRRVDALFAHYHKRRVPFFWIVHPSARPADLDRRLEARGMVEVEVCPGMAADLDELPEPKPAPEGVEIHEVVDEADAESFLELAAWRWHVPEEAVPHLAAINKNFGVGTRNPKARCWIAWRGGIPVAKAALHLAAGAAGIYAVATRPEARGLGLASVLTLEALRAGREKGYRLGILHSTPMALGLYEKLGFRSVVPFRVFASPRDELRL